MYQAKMALISEVEKALKQWKRGIWLRGLALMGLVATIGLGLMVLLRQQWVNFPLFIPILFALTLAGLVVIAYKYLFLPFRQKTSIPIAARSIESHHPHLEDRLVTAVEHAGKSDATSKRWLNRLLNDVREKTRDITLGKQLKVEGHTAWRTLFIVSLVALGGLLLSSGAWKGDFQAMVNSGFIPPKPPAVLEVTPGTAHIKKGTSLKVKAVLSNYAPESATIFYTDNDTAWQSTVLESNTSSGDFNYDFFDVQNPFQYYVTVGGELSDIFKVTVFEAPEIKRIDLTYTYPKHTGLPQRFEPDGGDIWAPVGTTIKVSVLSEGPFIAAQLLIGDADTKDMQLLSDTTAAGFLQVEKDSHYSIRLVNKENLDNAPFAEYYIHALQDNPPTIIVKKPSKDTKATMLEEIPVVAEIGNDFGLDYVQLAITVNSRPEIYIPMSATSSDVSKTDGLTFQYKDFSTQLYLEDLEVNVGDFVTYYVKVKDRSQPEETKSDMFFVDIKNFEDIYNVAESQGSGGAGNMGGGFDLSLSQREIITATTRLKRDQKKISQDEYRDRRDKIKDAQEEVRKTAEQVANMSKMQMGSGGDESQAMAAEFDAAVLDMKDALVFLGKDVLDSALVAERDAYTHLVRAEMAINQKQLQMSQSSGGGGGSRMQNTDELASLFQDELDKLKNKYETLQQGDKSQAQQAANEALQKIKELARRQQAINEMSRQLANKDLSEEEKKRELKKLQRQQEQLRRDTQQAMQQLNESLNQQQQSLSRDMTNEMQRASDEMNRASNSLRKQESQSALSSGQQAQDRLEEIEERLRKTQQNAMRDDLQELQDKMQQIADRQKRLADSTAARQNRQTSSDSSGSKSSSQADRESQENLRKSLEKTMQDMQQLTQNAEGNPEMQRGLSQLNRNMQRSDVTDKMQQAEQALEQNRLDQAEKLQRNAHNALSEGLQQMQRLTKGMESSKEEKLETALQEAQDLRDKLENQLQQAQRGDGQQRAQEDTNTNTSEQQGSRIGNPQTQDRRITQEMIEEWKESIWSTKERLEQLQRQIRADSLNFDNTGNRNDLEDVTRDAIDDLTAFTRTFVGGDQQRIEDVVEKLVDPLRRIEAELEAQLQLSKSKESLRTVREQPIPPEYKDMVEEYYRSLSKAKGSN